MKTENKYPKFFTSKQGGHALMIISENQHIQLTLYNGVVDIRIDELCDTDTWKHWLPIEISETEFKEFYLQAQNNLTLQYHNLFSATENEFIKNENLKSEGY